ncbi:MAG TPA: hypothetical protein VMF69_01120 [Gemmataceae bacterium]|nr:hypothetical protein [Gemmataceae bacterium]
MSERFQQDGFDFRAPNLIELYQPLPGWLADRLLRPDEKVTWVRGPRFNPSWERYITHPALFFLAAAVGAISVAPARLIAGQWSELAVILLLIAFAVVVAVVIVLGIASGYFTRLVVTDLRLVILQGYEICHSWDIDDLPPSLVRYGKREEKESWTIDLNAVKTMLGGSSDKFTDAKTILSFGKQLDRIAPRDKDHR